MSETATIDRQEGAAAPAAAAPDIVLRVLTGRLAGASHPLQPGRLIRAGHSFTHDVVLRGLGTSGVSAALHVVDGVATIKVISGCVSLLGRPLGDGETAQLPFYVPVMIGEFAVAVGDSESERWGEATSLCAKTLPVAGDPAVTEGSDGAQPPPTPLTLWESLLTRLYPARRRFSFTPNWPQLGIGMAVLLMVLAAIGPIWAWVDDSFGGPRYATQVLSAAGFRSVSVTRDPVTGALLVQGTVRTDADLNRLRALATASFGSSRFAVETTEAHAAAATEILTAQGLDARAKPVAVGVLQIETEYLAQDRQTAVREMLKIDLPAVKAIRFAPNSARGERGLQYFFASGPYGIASVVQGDPSYIVTADGTRWFTGATVPTGHKILAISATSISFERDGQIDELTL